MEKIEIEVHWLIYVLIVVLILALLKYIFTFPAIEIYNYSNCTIEHPNYYEPFYPYVQYNNDNIFWCNNCSDAKCNCVWV